MNTDLLHPREHLIGKFHSLALPYQVIHIFTYYSPAQALQVNVMLFNFFPAYKNALHSYPVTYEDTTHEPMSFKATYATQSLYFCQLNHKRGVNIPYRTIF